MSAIPKVIAALFIFTVVQSFRRRRLLPLAPGPTRLPFLGNVLQMSSLGKSGKAPWKQHAEWAATFGEIVYLEVFGKPIVVVNSLRGLRDLLEDRASIYSDRPISVMLHELVGFDWAPVMMSYGERWRLNRKIFDRHFHKSAIPELHPMLRHITSKLLSELHGSPANFLDHVYLFAGRIIFKVTYGYETPSIEDRYLQLAHTTFDIGERVASGGYMVDFFPILKYLPSWFPGAKFKRDAERWAPIVQHCPEKLFTDFKNSNVSCYITESLSRIKENEDYSKIENAIKGSAALGYGAGVGTTNATLTSFVLAMVLYPDVASRAQAEIDSVVGRSRLPDFEDRPNLPYLDAILLEILRWIPPIPLALAHSLMQDDSYNGYRLPAGSIVIPNAWAILHDPQLYPEPETFEPERFLDKQRDSLNPTEFAFGFGRRHCPGRHLAMDSTWLAMAAILSTFCINKAVDEFGNVITPKVEVCTSDVTCCPLPFPCIFKPRHETSIKLIDSGYGMLD